MLLQLPVDIENFMIEYLDGQSYVNYVHVSKYLLNQANKRILARCQNVNRNVCKALIVFLIYIKIHY